MMNTLRISLLTLKTSITVWAYHCSTQNSGSINSADGRMFFIDAAGGTGKTYLFNVMLDHTRLHGPGH